MTATPVRTAGSSEQLSTGARKLASGSLLPTPATPRLTAPPSNRTTPLSGRSELTVTDAVTTGPLSVTHEYGATTACYAEDPRVSGDQLTIQDCA